MFWELFRESAVMQGLLALVITVGVLTLYATGRPIPPEVWGIVGLVFGYYFGSDKRTALVRALRK